MRFVPLLLVLLGACALFPLGEADCRGVNWETRGYQDGYAGHPEQYLRLESECKRFGVVVDEAAYFKGWKDGRFEWDRLMGTRINNR
jgi:hypothetical protein